MSKYLSIDTEATGLEEHCLLIQVAVVPVDGTKNIIAEELGKEVLIQCPSFEELKPTLSEWVIQHNEGLIRKAHAEGIPPEAFKNWMGDYLNSDKVKAFFGGERPLLLGKSLSALDIPLLTKNLSKALMDKYFHHHTLDITCVGRFLVDAGILPPGHGSTTQLLKFFNLRAESKHTALSDAMDMAQIYLKLVKYLADKGLKTPLPTP
jgi:oligoribonuclease (3'-5' exoribonuclease)